MKKLKFFTLGAIFLIFSLFQTGCIGSFKMTNSLYDWNTSLDGKFTQEVVFLAFVIIPVYEVTLFIDGVILNSIEFWTGDNPMSMNEGEVQEQIVQNEGNSYKITATKNKFHVEQLDGLKEGQSYDLVYEPDELSWFLEANGNREKVVSHDAMGTSVKLYKPNGDVIQADPKAVSKNAVEAAINIEYEDITSK